MLAYLVINLLLSALVASQPLSSPGNDTKVSFITPRDSPAPSCGLLIDDDRVGNIMQKNDQCNSITRTATSLSLNEGCVCALFSSSCDRNNRDSWRWMSGVPHKNYDLTHLGNDIKWYRCFTEQNEAQVGGSGCADAVHIANASQDWVNSFADFIAQPRPTISVKDGLLFWE
jgi:hypothetical protein